MKSFTAFLLALALGAALAPGLLAAEADPLCQAKLAQLEQKLALARKAGNSNQAAGLEKALAQARVVWCNDGDLLAKARQEVQQKQEKAQERLTELNEARQEGKADKIAKRERKLKEAQAELQEAQATLSALEP